MEGAMSPDEVIIEGPIAERIKEVPGLLELLTARCKACKLYVAQSRRDAARARKLREADVRSRTACPRCGRLVCEHQPLKPVTEFLK